MSDPYSYPTWEDAVAYIPNLENDATAERLFNVFLTSMPGLVDPGLVGEHTFQLSLHLTLHFMSSIWEGGRKPKFDAESYAGSTGAVTAIEGEKLSLKFHNGESKDPWESDLSQTQFGQIYLQMIKAVRTIIGIDGRGKMWASL
jgi:hypothetical protein